MSLCTKQGLPVALQRLPIEQERFTQQLHKEWVDGDPQRRRQLAALTLHAHGWTYRDIALVFGLASDGGSVVRMVSAAKLELQEDFAPPAAPADDGFSNPSIDHRRG
jgi:hypothetical protein